MTKTQIQLPDELYRQVKAFAASREWSLAETFRRAVEEMFERYPQADTETTKPWSLPEPRDLGWKGLTPEELHRTVIEDMEPHLP